jgi:hypothetical protein
MSDSYHLDLQHIPLEKYKQTLKAAELIPSRRALKEQIDDRFSRLRVQGIANLAEFLDAAKITAKVAELAGKTGIPVEYLTLLRREVNALLPNPKNLKDFPGGEGSIVEKLAARGIKNTKQLFESALTGRQRADLAREAGIGRGDRPGRLPSAVRQALQGLPGGRQQPGGLQRAGYRLLHPDGRAPVRFTRELTGFRVPPRTAEGVNICAEYLSQNDHTNLIHLVDLSLGAFHLYVDDFANALPSNMW